MAHFTIDDQDCSPGHLNGENRLEFGGLYVEYNPSRNRFELSHPHSSAELYIFEADIPAFVGFLLKHFQPFDSRIQREEGTKDAATARRLQPVVGYFKRTSCQ